MVLRVGCSCLQLAGAAFGGRDAESKGDEGERETKSAADGEYVRVRVDHASSLGVCLDSSSNLPSNRALFVKVRSHAACAPRRRLMREYCCTARPCSQNITVIEVLIGAMYVWIKQPV